MTRLVGIIAHELPAAAGGSPFDHYVVATGYAKAVARTGATPVSIPMVGLDDPDALRRVIERFDAIVLTGGADVDPSTYGRDRLPECGPSSSARDSADIAAARACVDLDIPTLAICRGVQVLNVALGGTLTQHIDDHMVIEQASSRAHGLDVRPDSTLASILGPGPHWSNSLHHQCIDTLGAGVRVVARADDATVEAIEVEHAPNVLGVQWHPELLRHDDSHLGLFRWLFER